MPENRDSQARRAPRRSAVGRSAAAAVGRPVGRPVAVTMRSVGRVAVSVSVDFQFKAKETLPNLCLPENKRGVS